MSESHIIVMVMHAGIFCSLWAVLLCIELCSSPFSWSFSHMRYTLYHFFESGLHPVSDTIGSMFGVSKTNFVVLH